MIEILRNLMDFNTTCDTGSEKACAHYIAETLSEYGIETQLYEPYPDRVSVSAVIQGKSRETLLLHGHIDTASYGNPQEWLFPPDHATFHKDCICGRGALDCKSQLAVFMKIMIELKQSDIIPGRTIRFLATADEEQGGEKGMRWIKDNTRLLENVFLALGEGGGFPFPYDGKIYYTFQTGENCTLDDTEVPIDKSKINKRTPEEILNLGIQKGYYSESTKEYCLKCKQTEGRRLDVTTLYEGIEEFLGNAPSTKVYQEYAELFLQSLKSVCPNAKLIPVITPGYSDNRYIRIGGIPIIGFFPLDIKNHLSGIHSANEYISKKSLNTALSTLKKIISNLLLTEK